MLALNELRHWLIGRRQQRPSAENLSMLRDALEFSVSKELSGKMLSYSFRRPGDNSKAAAIKLYEAITSTIISLWKTRGTFEPHIEAFNRALNANSTEQISNEDKERVMDIIKRSMAKINQDTRNQISSKFGKA
jgi:hypothetical protein